MKSYNLRLTGSRPYLNYPFALRIEKHFVVTTNKHPQVTQFQWRWRVSEGLVHAWEIRAWALKTNKPKLQSWLLCYWNSLPGRKDDLRGTSPLSLAIRLLKKKNGSREIRIP